MMETSKNEQLRPGLWDTVNERYPGSMIKKDDFIPLAPLKKPIRESKLAFISTSGVQLKGTLPFDTVHPIGDYTYRKVPSSSKPADLEIHQLKYPTVGANRDINVIYPIERLQELAEGGVIGGLTENFFSFIGYNMDPDKLEETLAENIADAVVKEHADIALLAPA
ncbi:glycine/sarcosine/betaine reductase selenoprotein B family protein [Litchfieldia alkalitelluris]|uniref:glycine/sarcosine/betaine reductase selenoprotein B family protein n=1 Tax=Litchfieldia alkalitelluris TaxID=304268 RepID=UPI0009976CBE|nr:glycine/sarcosine/betaine reductase selenoprotein B family protein [Litchfieldia alkalitelluris]